MKTLWTSAAVLTAAFACSCASTSAQAGEAPATTADAATTSSAADGSGAGYDQRLSTYGYPFEVKVRRFEEQGLSLEMAYMVVEPSSTPKATVLLLHGKNFSGAYWERTANDLVAQGYRVVMPDQIGFGKSSKPTTYQYSFAAMARQTMLLLDELAVGQVVVVGHSMGGMLATRFALDYPGRTAALALVNPIGLEDWRQWVPYVPVDVWKAGELKKTPDAVRDYMKTAYFDGQWQPAYDAIADIQMGWSMRADKAILAEVSARTYDMIFTQPVVYEFGRLKAPTLLIIGTRDRTALGKPRASAEDQPKMGLYEQLGKATAEAIEGAKLVEIDGVGHVPQVEAYDVYIEALTAFVDEQAPSTEAP